MMFFSSGTEIRRYVHNAKKSKYSDVLINEYHVQNIDVDPDWSMIYWTDSSLRTIKRAMIPDVDQLTFSQDLRIHVQAPHGIAFDWITK